MRAMNVRDWLAGQALAGGESEPAEVARRCYAIAEAMLIERRRERWPMGRPDNNGG